MILTCSMLCNNQVSMYGEKLDSVHIDITGKGNNTSSASAIVSGKATPLDFAHARAPSPTKNLQGIRPSSVEPQICSLANNAAIWMAFLTPDNNNFTKDVYTKCSRITIHDTCITLHMTILSQI
nr:hypothetical protein Iba_chr12bCG4690 [Ipomoea batatas]